MADVNAIAAAALREFGADTPTTQTVMRVAVSLAATVNRLPGLRGREKADLVLGALRQALNTPVLKEKIPAEAHAALLATVDTVVPETLNLVVAAGRGELDFRRPSVGCLAAIARAFCRSAAAVAVSVPGGGQVAAVANDLKEGDVAERAIGIAETAVASLETVVATVTAAAAEAPAIDSTAPPTTPPTEAPALS